MMAIISPAKNMIPIRTAHVYPKQPKFKKRADILWRELKEYSPWQLESIFQESAQQGMKAFERYQQYDPQELGSAAVCSYQGLQYIYLDPLDFSADDFSFADQHLRILSAFYGALCPSDGIQPYRLKMECKLTVENKKLYEFWGNIVYREVYSAGGPVINLASKEYAKMITPYLTYKNQFITCDFLARRKGKLICIPTLAKMARGRMARYIIKNRIDTPEKLYSFSPDHYRYLKEMSTKDRYVFLILEDENELSQEDI